MRKLALIGCIVLGACSQAATAIQDASAISPTVIKDTCAALSFADLGFKAAIGPLKISAADQAKEASVMTQVQSVCAQAPADAQAAFSFLTQAMSAISSGASTGTVTAPAPPTAGATTPAASS